MKDLKPHPRLALRHERFGSKASAVNLSGFIAPSPNGLVRLFPTPNANDYIELPESAILHFEQDEKSLETELFLSPSTIVTVVSLQKLPLVALARLQQGGGPDGGIPKSCLEKRIENCKNDPTVKNKDYCESEHAKRTFQLLCDVFGDPKISSGGAVIL